ncbi:MAG: FadR family transcriptional regulator [Micrococcaceae bacterium]|nr:FadR family transcriptional regulator [Micrococcaceae bacterium]
MADFLTTLSRRMVLAPLDDTGRTQEVADRLRTAIFVGIFADGERLPVEVSLARQLGISPVTLRDAIKTLRHEGLVRTARGRSGGTFVTSTEANTLTFLQSTFRQLTPIELRDLNDLQMSLMAHSSRLAAERGTERELDSLLLTVQGLHANEDAVTLRRKFSRFLIGVSAASRSGRVSKATIELQVELAPFVTLILQKRSSREEVIFHMTSIVESLKSRDSEQAYYRTYQLVEGLGYDLQRLHFELSQDRAG